jgi:hypothetical protein
MITWIHATQQTVADGMTALRMVCLENDQGYPLTQNYPPCPPRPLRHLR